MRAHSRFDFSFAFILFLFELTASNSFDLNLNLKIVCVCFVAKYNEKIKMNGFLKYLMISFFSWFVSLFQFICTLSPLY